MIFLKNNFSRVRARVRKPFPIKFEVRHQFYTIYCGV